MNGILDERRYAELLEIRTRRPEAVMEAARRRRRRELLGPDGNLLIIAADHPGRRIVGVGGDPLAMGDRRRLLERLLVALARPGVDGLLATPDIVEDLLLLDALHDRVVFGSMNRGGLTGSAWELADGFTAYDAVRIEEMGLEGGKMLLRLDYSDPDSRVTLEACAAAVTSLAERRLVAMVEPLPVRRDASGRLRVDETPEALIEVIGIASALGATSAYTWLKLPAPTDPERVMAATTLPCLLLGGDPGERTSELLGAWKKTLALPNVRGLVAGRSLLYPPDGDVARWVDAAAELVHGG